MTTDFETLRARVTAAQAALLGPVDKLETLSVAVLLDEALLHADNMTQWMQEWEYQAQLWGQNALHSQAERDEARKMLAECYVLSGADPDGDDWRHLWQTAVAEVRQTMEEHRAEVEALVAERDEARAEMAAIRAALGNGADEAAWPSGLTLAEVVGRLRGERDGAHAQNQRLRNMIAKARSIISELGHCDPTPASRHHCLRHNSGRGPCPVEQAQTALIEATKPAGHEGPHAEALGDNGGPNG